MRWRAVKLPLEEGFPVELVARELGVSSAAVTKWLQKYRRGGEQGLQDHDRRPGAARLPAPVRARILELKQEDPARGIKRVSQLLQRVFFLKAGSHTIRQTLHREHLIQRPPKPRCILVRPRFFEWATPNQMWQSNSFIFRLGGALLI